jgi:ribosomal protein S12 methylthiotransferase accessory factor
MGRHEEALDYFGRAAELDDSQWEIIHLTGFCQFSLKQFEAAMESFSKAIELSPGSGIDYANLGSCLRELGRRAEAVGMYKNALELDPSLDFARENIRRLTGEDP